MSGILRRLLPHFLVLIGFIVVSLAYFSPVLQGKEIFQSDIAQYIGMSRQQTEFREETGEEPYWTDAAFGGMPTYQLGAQYPHNYVKLLDSALRFLPRPADYLFLYFIGLYVLFLVMRIDYKLAFLGALAFGFSTYLIIILGVGHNAKAHAIAYMPLVLGGILLCFRRRYLVGFLLLSVGMALEISANHFQMTYYLLLLVLVLGGVYLYDAFKKKELPYFLKSLGIMLGAVILAVGANATNLLATQEYTEFSTRGKSELTIDPAGNPAMGEGLDYRYITEYSYGILETFNLFIPRLMGGSSSEKLDRDSHVFSELMNMGATPVQAQQFLQSAPTYWGEQPFVGAPAYIGATVIFLFVLALFLVKGKLKWWIVGGSVLALLLSWGKNFGFLTHFFIEYVPLYNKFRAVSSIQIILELCIPILATLGLSRFFYSEGDREEKLHALKWASIIPGGLALFFLLFPSVLFDFSGPGDRTWIQQLGVGFMDALKEDRREMFKGDTLRSFVLVLLSAGVLFLYLKQKLSRNAVIGVLALLILFDLVGVNRRYVNNDDFVSAFEVRQPFQANDADLQILRDTTHYRVFDVSGNPFNTARTSYFHNSIGGYHAAKPGRMQELFDFHISQNNMEVLNMLNTKYFIVPTEEGVEAQQNPDANGNAWFIEEVEFVDSANEEVLSLGDLDTKRTAVVHEKFKSFLKSTKFRPSASSNIELRDYRPNRIVYHYKAASEQLAVFSEVYYSKGWKAYVDGEPVPHFRTNYVLRGMVVPPGKHEIIFEFKPEVINTGSTISLISSILLMLVLLGGIFYGYKRKEFLD